MEETSAPIRTTLVLADNDEALHLLGNRDENLRAIQKHFSARIFARGTELNIERPAEQVQQITSLLEELPRLARRGHPITLAEVEYMFPDCWVEEPFRPLIEALFPRCPSNIWAIH